MHCAESTRCRPVTCLVVANRRSEMIGAASVESSGTNRCCGWDPSPTRRASASAGATWVSVTDRCSDSRMSAAPVKGVVAESRDAARARRATRVVKMLRPHERDQHVHVENDVVTHRDAHSRGRE